MPRSPSRSEKALQEAFVESETEMLDHKSWVVVQWFTKMGDEPPLVLGQPETGEPFTDYVEALACRDREHEKTKKWSPLYKAAHGEPRTQIAPMFPEDP